MSLALAYPGAHDMADAKPFKIELPEDERGRNEHDMARLAVLNARLSKPAKARGRLNADDAREADLKERAALEGRPVISADRKWATAANEETARLAEGRGEEVGRNPSGAVNIRSRDSLQNLMDAGKLTQEQYDVGRACRDAYEARSTLGSQAGNLAASASAHNNDRFVFNALQRAKTLQRIPNIERAIWHGHYIGRNMDGSPVIVWIELWQTRMLSQDRPDPKLAREAFATVIERNEVLRTLGGGRAFDRNVAALKFALDVAEAVVKG